MKASSAGIRGALAGLAGGVAWLVGMLAFFGPAQRVLTDPNLQSAKFLATLGADPVPRINGAPWVMLLGLLGIGVLWGWVFVWLSGSWTAPWWQRGLRFGTAAWVLMVPWFEFYLPWNVMHEPALLVALEMVCWAGVLLVVGLTIAGVETKLRR